MNGFDEAGDFALLMSNCSIGVNSGMGIDLLRVKESELTKLTHYRIYPKPAEFHWKASDMRIEPGTGGFPLDLLESPQTLARCHAIRTIDRNKSHLDDIK